jgi:hypothetical protein
LRIEAKITQTCKREDIHLNKKKIKKDNPKDYAGTSFKDLKQPPMLICNILNIKLE